MRHEEAMAFRDAAARPVIEQIREDQKQIDNPARRILERLEQEFLSPGLKVTALIRASKARGSRSLERLQAVTGLTLSGYLLEARGEVALRLLRGTELPIEEIAGLAGFAAAPAFCRAFRRWYGVAPGIYRENVRAARARGVELADPAEIRYRQLLPLTVEGADPVQLEAVIVEEASARGVALPAICQAETAEQLEVEAARLWWERLRGLPFEEQRESILAGFRFQTSAMVEHLLRMSREEGRSNRRRGFEVARLALEKAERLGSAISGSEHSQLMARAWMTLGNAHRLMWEHREAEEAFATAALLLADPATPRALRAELAYSQCQLRQYQRRFTNALEHADRAVALSENDSGSLVIALLCRGGVYWHLGEWQRAAADFAAAGQSQELSGKPFLHFAAVQNLADTLVQWGRYDEAGAQLTRAKELGERLGEPVLACHIRWLEGLLARHTGCSTIAETHLTFARAGFRSLEELGHFAIVSLDLATLLLWERRAEEALATVGEALPQLEALRLEDEGLIALRLLQQAVTEGEVSIALVENVRASARRLLGTRPPELAVAPDHAVTRNRALR